MKKILFTSVFLSTFLSLAQGQNDFSIKFKSGDFLPVENFQRIQKTDSLWDKSKFNGKNYLVLQFFDVPSEELKKNLSNNGVTLIDYIPNYTYTAVLNNNFDFSKIKKLPIRSIFLLENKTKKEFRIINDEIPQHAISANNIIELNILTFEEIPSIYLKEVFNLLNIKIVDETPIFRSFRIKIPKSKINLLVNLPFIQWIEPIAPPVKLENILGRTLHSVNTLNDGVRNLNGSGIKIGIWDGGEVSKHLDFAPLNSRLTMIELSSESSHATHVAGTIGGGGLLNSKAKGMASKSTLFSWNFNGAIQTEMASAIPFHGLSVSNHSYGWEVTTCGGINGNMVAYDATSRNTDINLNNNPNHLHIHSAGNAQSVCVGGWSTISGSGKPAKNNIVVASITSTNTISNFSSFGPVTDGRIKPEISAFGQGVLSTYTPLNTYGTISGTSMATPGVAGSVSLLVERYKQLNANNAPISSLIKGLVCNAATDLGNPGPDYKFGFGKINALAAVKALEESRFNVDLVTQGVTITTNITIPAGAVRLKVMLTWNDPAGASNANPALVNDLNLNVVNSGTTNFPWLLDKNNPALNATKGVDNISNIEQVSIDNPVAGSYLLNVIGTTIAQGSSQQYSLTWEIESQLIEITYPNGNEKFEPNSSETITWNNIGVTSNQTIQYSLNSGTTWITISSTVPSTTTRFVWTVPSGISTSTALIKIFSGTLTDTSDTNFSVLGTPTNVNVRSCANNVFTISWSTVANATHYDVLNLDTSTGIWNIIASNTTNLLFNTQPFPQSSTCWFSVIAKNTTQNIVSEKAIAVSGVSQMVSSLLAIISPTESLTFYTGGNVLLNANSGSGFTFQWNKDGQLISGATSNPLIVTNGGNYTVTITQNSCSTTSATTVVTVNPVPTISGTTSNFICNSGIVNIGAASSVGTVNWYSVSLGGSSIFTGSNFTTPNINTTTTYYADVTVPLTGVKTATIGTGSTTTNTTGVTPYSSYYEGSREQYLIRAAELQSNGLNAGNIYGLEFNVTALGAGTFAQSNFKIKIAHTADNSITGVYATTSSTFTDVYGPIAKPLPRLGWNYFNFSTPFIWDGVSNIIVDICHDNDVNNTCPGCYSTNSTVQYTETAYNSVFGSFADEVQSCGLTASSIITNTFYRNRPNIKFTGELSSQGVSPRVSVTATVNQNVIPTFTQVATTCSGAILSALPIISENGITGTWSPALNNIATTLYTFTPTAGQCATTFTITITINPNISPTFTQVAAICSGAILSALPLTSSNGITGTWSPALNNIATTLYTFTPTAGQCATTSTMTITINPSISPTFTQVAAICSGAILSALPLTSSNGITGTWSPALNNIATTLYTFTPTAGQCATTFTMTITVFLFYPFYVDFDRDSFGAITQQMVCSTSPTVAPIGYSTNNADCNDSSYSLTNTCNTIVTLKLFIEGYYDYATNAMRPVKANQGIGSNSTLVDDITVELRNTSNVLIASLTADLQTNGTALCAFTSSPNGLYYIAVKHRNSIETWSANTVSVGTIPINYDFTTGANKAYGNNMKLLAAGVFGFYSGDLNQDGFIEGFDFPPLFNDNDNSVEGYFATDLNGDGFVEGFDYPILFNNSDNSIESIHP